jgi:WD40 repeat protein
VLAFGFYGTRAILFDISEQRVLFSINCGGFKRPFDISLSQGDKFAFAFQKDAMVYEYSPAHKPNQIFLKSTLHNPYHWRETNSIQLLPIDKKDSDRLTFVTTSEDTAISVGSVNMSRDVEIMHKILSHDSATRCSDFALCDGGQALLVVGGGRLQLRIFKESRTGSNSFVHVASADPPPRRSGNKKKRKDDYDECRIMSVTITNIAPHTFAVASARSDAIIDVWTYRDDVEGSRVEFLIALRHQHAVLSMASMFFEGSLLLISACTDGSLHFWDFNAALKSFLSTRTLAAPASLSAPSFVTLHANSPQIDPILVTKPHQAGINALDIDFNSASSRLTVVTSGDDQDLCVQPFAVALDGHAVKLTQIQDENIKQENMANSCVSGAKFCGSRFIVTVSGDQRLVVWDRTDLALVASTMLHISDVSDVDVAGGDDQIVAIAVGQGLEVVHMDLS